MQSHISLKWSALVLCFVLVACSSLFISFAAADQTSQPVFVQTVAIAKAAVQQQVFDVPVHLTIPDIHVNALVLSVGLTSDGAMGVPKGPNEMAWFNLGPKPGEVGSAVIDGHSGWKNNIPAVFDNLYKLHKGNKIYVEDAKGTTIVFIVKEVRLFGQYDNASSVFGSNDGKVHLNLITCTGVWNSIKRSSSERVVVFADQE